MKTLLTIGCIAFMLSSCSTTDTSSDISEQGNQGAQQKDMQGNVIDESNTGVNVIGGDTVIQETDGYQTTVTPSKGDTSVIDLPGLTDSVDTDGPR